MADYDCMRYDPRAIANEFLDLADAERETISPMKLQKLVYYTYGWCLAVRGKRLFADGIQAWKYGPVVPSIYHEFKQYGNDPIRTPASTIAVDTDEGLQISRVGIAHGGEEVDFVRRLVKRVWDVYKKYSAVQLSNATHAAGTPWHATVMQCGGELPPSRCIDDTLIRDYFLARAQQAN